MRLGKEKMKASHLRKLDGSLAQKPLKPINDNNDGHRYSVLKTFVSLETELPEALFSEMNEFIRSHPSWDQYSFISSALANFLFQNGCTDRAVTDKYLHDLFNRSEVLEIPNKPCE